LSLAALGGLAAARRRRARAEDGAPPGARELGTCAPR
jgi:hypothetical protein